MPQYSNASLERGFQILEFLAGQRQPTDLSVVAKHTQLPTSTAFRFLAILQNMGYVQKTESDRYWLGYRLFKLSGYANEITLVKRAANHILARLSHDVGLTVHMGALEGSKVVYHAKFESEKSMRIVSETGLRLDAHVSALGKVLLSQLPEHDFDRLYKMQPLRRHTANSITNLEKLKRELAEVRKSGVGNDNEEIAPGLRCVAVPVYDHEKELVCAISISGSTIFVTAEALPLLTKKLKAAAQEIAGALTGRQRAHHDAAAISAD